MGLTIGHSTSAGEEIQKLAPKAKVVKAFNTLFAQVLANGGKAGGRTTTVFVAGDDASANDAVEAIARKAGFDVVQTGGLKFARYLEPLAGLKHRAGLRPRPRHGHRPDLDRRRRQVGVSRRA